MSVVSIIQLAAVYIKSIYTLKVMPKFIKYDTCPRCGSEDNLLVYSDGFQKCTSIGCSYVAYNQKHSKILAIKKKLERIFKKK